MKKALFALTALLAIAAGCAKDSLKSESPIGKKASAGSSITATIGEFATKATLDYEADPYQMVWVDNDSISVFGRLSGRPFRAEPPSLR